MIYHEKIPNSQFSILNSLHRQYDRVISHYPHFLAREKRSAMLRGTHLPDISVDAHPQAIRSLHHCAGPTYKRIHSGSRMFRAPVKGFYEPASPAVSGSVKNGGSRHESYGGSDPFSSEQRAYHSRQRACPDIKTGRRHSKQLRHKKSYPQYQPKTPKSHNFKSVLRFIHKDKQNSAILQEKKSLYAPILRSRYCAKRRYLRSQYFFLSNCYGFSEFFINFAYRHVKTRPKTRPIH